MTNLVKSTIRLFKAVPIAQKKSKTKIDLHKETITSGFILSPDVISNYTPAEIKQVIADVNAVLGLSAMQMNASFHKSWKKVKDASLEQLALEQIFHYLTTYGKEAGLFNFDADFVYIPSEALEIPKLNLEKISLVLIKGLTKSEIKERLLTLLSSGIALSASTIEDILVLIDYTSISEKELALVKNREVRSALYNLLELVPEDPVELLRLLVYITTEQTLLIKNRDLIGKIEAADKVSFAKSLALLSQYEKTHGLKRLAEIFYRFKPLFLAFKHGESLSRIINKTRKLATVYHKPMPEDYLNSITGYVKNEKTINQDKFASVLEKASIFRKIRLAYALKFRTTSSDSILYRIRNGKAYAADFSFSQKKVAVGLLEKTLQAIAQEMSPKVKGKRIYIPSHMYYTLPATEKQFTGNFPSGSYVTVPNDMIFGIHWENVEKTRIDLDLSIMSLGTKYGWDSYYRSSTGGVLFSGDVTDASLPHGASEFFYLAKKIDSAFLVMVNYYNSYAENCPEVPLSIIVAKEQVKSFGKDYIVNPNNILAVSNTTITQKQKQKLLGLMISDADSNRFYFIETNMGNAISSRSSKLTETSRKYMLNYYNNSIELEDLLRLAGAKVVRDNEKVDIDLSPEAISKDSFLSIL